MISKDRDVKRQGRYPQSLLRGLFGVAAFIILLLIAASLSENNHYISGGKIPIAKLALAVAAFLSGYLGCRGIQTEKLLHALAGETALLVLITICAVATETGCFNTSFLADIGIMLFGGFAGALPAGRRKTKRRGNR